MSSSSPGLTLAQYPFGRAVRARVDLDARRRSKRRNPQESAIWSHETRITPAISTTPTERLLSAGSLHSAERARIIGKVSGRRRFSTSEACGCDPITVAS